ncbi:MAG: 16S rRNA (guanine(966)-N(2))-methyltransferase RsmD [Clostridia bacterium]|nr:16S rRNA (guanine(966)-N(2))-methyltransferase RsmD [Clostridia bacterium]
MRIVGGKYRGRVLAEVNFDGIRPTSDMARESLFNILQFKVIDAEVLDLFCGTGAIGIEALSRGAKRVVFNDADKKSLQILKNNLLKLKVDEPYSIKNLDAINFLDRTDEKFDIVYIDPPYKSDLKREAVQKAERVIKDNGLIILEDEKEFDGQIDRLKITDRRKYGRVKLTFFQKEEN